MDTLSQPARSRRRWALLPERALLPWRARSDQGGRLLGVDVARAVALLGMAVTHVFSATGQDGRHAAAHDVFAGRSSALFAVLAGVSIALLTGRQQPLRGSARTRASLALALRAVLIGALGMALVALDSGIAVILTYYGLLFLCALPFLGLRAPVLLALGAAGTVVLPLLSYVVRDRFDLVPTFEQPSVSRLDEPVQLLQELALTGYYPVLPWLAYLLVGLGVGRLALASDRVATGLATAGAALALSAHLLSGVLLRSAGGADALAPSISDPEGIGVLDALAFGSYGVVPTDTAWWLVVDGPHTGTPFDLAATTGTALLVLGASLLLVRRVRSLLLPLAAVGSMTLSLYSAHVLLVSRWDQDGAAAFYTAQVLLALVGALLWRTLIGRGPLEAPLAALTRLVRVAGRRSEHRRTVR